jgi:hypothetical protein
MSLESDFKEHENDFRNNATKEERHRIDEVLIDEQSLKYSQLNHTEPMTIHGKSNSNETNSNGDESDETTVPTIVAVGTKKGKYLDLMPPGEDNMNTSLPNTAEVWALASMRDMDGRKNHQNEDVNDDVELLNANMNNTVKNLLDLAEIARHDNTTAVEIVTKADKYDNDDPQTAENKEIAVSTIALQSPTKKSIIEDNRIELEHENVHLNANRSNHQQPALSRIDADIFAKVNIDHSVELISSTFNGKKNEKLRMPDTTQTTTTESTTSFELDDNDSSETTTLDSGEIMTSTTQSTLDNFTVIGEDEENSEVFKRTITEMPISSTQLPITTTDVPITSTIIPLNDETTQKFNKSTMVTKSISIRIATTTTEQPDIDTTVSDSAEISSTAFTYSNEDFNGSASSIAPTVITDNDKFKYNTLLPETTSSIGTTNLPDTSRSGKNGLKSEDGIVAKENDTLNKESLDGDGMSGGSIAFISIAVSIVVFLILAAGGFVSLIFINI